MKTKYVIECTEDNVTCTLRQHFEKYYPELDHDLVKFPIIDLYYGIIDGEIRAVPSYHNSYACLSVDEANAFMSSERKQANKNIPNVVQQSELLMVFDSFFEWHKKQGYVSIKRDDFEEYLKTINRG